jgi:hypothetical protein
VVRRGWLFISAAVQSPTTRVLGSHQLLGADRANLGHMQGQPTLQAFGGRMD